MNKLLDLYLTFARIGGLTFGGGYAMLPMMQQEIVDKKQWATEDEILDYYAIGQSTPGIIAVSTATFIGYKHKGIIGGITATLGLITPSIIIIILIASFISSLSDNEIVQHAFGGIRVGVTVLVISAVMKLWKTGIKDKIGVIIFIIAFCISAFTPIPTVLIVLLGIITGITISKFKKGDRK